MTHMTFIVIWFRFIDGESFSLFFIFSRYRIELLNNSGFLRALNLCQASFLTLDLWCRAGYCKFSSLSILISTRTRLRHILCFTRIFTLNTIHFLLNLLTPQLKWQWVIIVGLNSTIFIYIFCKYDQWLLEPAYFKPYHPGVGLSQTCIDNAHVRNREDMSHEEWG